MKGYDTHYNSTLKPSCAPIQVLSSIGSLQGSILVNQWATWYNLEEERGMFVAAVSVSSMRGIYKRGFELNPKSERLPLQVPLQFPQFKAGAFVGAWAV